jgi:hypothetical protein
VRAVRRGARHPLAARPFALQFDQRQGGIKVFNWAGVLHLAVPVRPDTDLEQEQGGTR